MNHLHYLQELSYLIDKPGISGIPKARVMIALYGLTDHLLNSSSYSSGELPNQLDAMGNLGISILDEYSDYFYNKRKSNDIITDSIRDLNELYKANKERTITAASNKKLYSKILNIDEKDIDEIDVVYNTASYGDGSPTDCCNQSGIVPCDEPLTTLVRYSGQSFVFNTPVMESGVFESGVNIEIIKGRDNIFDIYTIANDVGPDGSGTIPHPFSIINFQTIDCSTGLLDPTINTDGIFTANGTITINPPLDSKLTQLKYTCHDGEDALNSGDTETHIHGTGENIDTRHERGKIKVSDPFKANILPVRPEYVIESGTHDHIPSKFWDFDEDIPCKYGGLSKIKAFTNRKAHCFDQNSFVFEAEGWLGAQQFYPDLPDAVSVLDFREGILYPTANTAGIMQNRPNKFLHSSNLQDFDDKFILNIGQNPEPDLRIYDSRGDVDHTIFSTRWPAERINLGIRPNYLTLPDVQCPTTEEELQKEVYVVDDYGSPLCYPTGFTSFRNISLVDIRTNAYAVENTTQAETLSAFTSMYTKTLKSLPNIYLDENYDFLFPPFSIKDRAKAGLKTYEFYYANLVVENREWDANAGHAYLQTNISVKANAGTFLITDVAEISRNDYEIGSVDWFMGSSIPGGGGAIFEARGGISIFRPFQQRCPGDFDTPEGLAAIFDCFRRISLIPEYSSCQGDDDTFIPGEDGFHDNDIMTFLPYDLNLPPGTILSDFIKPGYIVEGPYVLPGTYVVSIDECSGSCSNPGVCLDCCGPVVKLNRAFIFSDYEISSQFPGTNYYPYRFRDPAGLATESLNINYFVRSNKAVLYTYAVYITTIPPGPMTIFTAFEYFEVWLSLFGSPQPVIYPKYKVPSLVPTQSYGRTNFTFSNWDACYRPVSLSAYESKVSQPGAGVSSSTYLAGYGYSRMGCKGLLPFYDLTQVDGGFLCPDELDPFCVLCDSRGAGFNNPYGFAPCLAEDVLDYENNSFFNLPVVESLALTESVFAGHTVQVLGFVIIVELNFAATFSLSGSVTVAGFPSVQVNLFPGGDTVTVPYTPGESTSDVLRFQTSLPGSALYDGGTIVVDSNNEIVLSGGSILDETGAVVVLQESSSIVGSRYGPAFDTSGSSTGHEGNSKFPAGIVPDPVRRFPKGDLGISAGEVSDAFVYGYYGYINPVSDIVENHNRTHRPKDVGGYDFPDFGTFYTQHPKSQEINAPSSPEIFRVYSPDGYASFLVGMIGEVGLIEHKYHTPKCKDFYDERNGFPPVLRAPQTDEERENLLVCTSEVVPISLGTLHFETKLNNLHINVAQGHDPVGNSSYPDSWTRKYIENPVNYTGIAGVLVPPTGFTVFKNDLILQHQPSSMSYNEAASSANMGLVSNQLNVEDNAGEYVVDKRVVHTTTNVQRFSGGVPSDYYCYQLPDKILSDGICSDTFFGPRSYDRLLLGDPYEDYLGVWAQRCCKVNGCPCPDDEFDTHGIQGSMAKSHNTNAPGVNHISNHTWDLQCEYCLGLTSYELGDATISLLQAIDDRVDNLGRNIFDEYSFRPLDFERLADQDGFCDHGIHMRGQSGGWGFFAAGYGGVPGYQTIHGDIINDDIDCCEIPSDIPCPVYAHTIQAVENIHYCSDCQWWRNVDTGETVFADHTETGTNLGQSGYQTEVQIYYDKATDGVTGTLYARVKSVISYMYPQNIVWQVSPDGRASITNAHEFELSNPGPWDGFSEFNCSTQFGPSFGYYGVHTMARGSFGASHHSFCIVSDTGFESEDYSDWAEIPCVLAGESNVGVSLANQYIEIDAYFGGNCFYSFVLSPQNCIMGEKNVYP